MTITNEDLERLEVHSLVMARLVTGYRDVVAERDLLKLELDRLRANPLFQKLIDIEEQRADLEAQLRAAAEERARALAEPAQRGKRVYGPEDTL